MSERVRNWEQRVMEERTSEIYKRMKNKKEEEERQAEEADKKQEIVWREQGKLTTLYSNFYNKNNITT